MYMQQKDEGHILNYVVSMYLLAEEYSIWHWYIISIFTQKYSKCEQLLCVQEGGVGVFRPEVCDPEMSSAGSTHLWELSTLSVRISHMYLSIYGEVLALDQRQLQTGIRMVCCCALEYVRLGCQVINESYLAALTCLPGLLQYTLFALLRHC